MLVVLRPGRDPADRRRPATDGGSISPRAVADSAKQSSRTEPGTATGQMVLLVDRSIFDSRRHPRRHRARHCGGGQPRPCAARGCPSAMRPTIREAVGDGAPVLIGRIVPADGRGDAAEVLRGFREYYPRHMFDTQPSLRRHRSLLAALATARRRMAVLSNKPDEMTQAMAGGALRDRCPSRGAGASDRAPENPARRQRSSWPRCSAFRRTAACSWATPRWT